MISSELLQSISSYRQENHNQEILLIIEGYNSQGSNMSGAQAYRDNSRMSVDSKALADLLWQNGSLQEVFQDYPINGSHAVGLNPNIRFYK